MAKFCSRGRQKAALKDRLLVKINARKHQLLGWKRLLGRKVLSYSTIDLRYEIRHDLVSSLIKAI